MPNTDSNNQSGSPPPALTAAIERILRPLVGLLLEYGLTYSWLSGVLKSIYVDVAEREFRLPNKRQTDSRITLLTGVHRKDVRRLRENPIVDSPPPASVYLGAQLVAVWTSESRFLNQADRPKPLARLARKTQEASFEDLVTSVSKDIRPRAVLDEWLRLGVVEIDQDDRVVLKEDAFIPSEGFEEKAFYLGRNIHDHLAAARHNVQGKSPTMLERGVYYDDLSLDAVHTLAEMSEREAMQALKKINAAARKLQIRDRNADDARYRMNFGTYFYNVDEDAEASVEPDKDAPSSQPSPKGRGRH